MRSFSTLRRIAAAAALATLDAKTQQDRRGAAKPSAHRYEVRRPFSLK